MARRQTSESLRIDGLAELSKHLNSFGPDLKKELRQANKEAAGPVAQDAASKARSLGGVAAHVAPSLKPAAGADWAGVALGGGAYPMAAGAEFGSDKFKQFKPWRGTGQGAGYFLYPTIRGDMDRIEGEYLGALDDLLRKNGLL